MQIRNVGCTLNGNAGWAGNARPKFIPDDYRKITIVEFSVKVSALAFSGWIYCTSAWINLVYPQGYLHILAVHIITAEYHVVVKIFLIVTNQCIVIPIYFITPSRG